MSLDLRRELSTYGRYLEDLALPIAPEEYQPETASLGPERRYPRPARRLLIAVGVAAAVLLLIGVTAALFGGSPGPVVDDAPPRPTTVPDQATTTPAQTTVPPTIREPGEQVDAVTSAPDGAAVDDSPPTTAPEFAAPTATPLGPGTWMQTDPDLTGFDEDVHGFESLTATSAGLVAATQRCSPEGTECVPTSWTSQDGRSWTETKLPEDFRVVSFFAGGPGALAITNQPEEGIGGRPGVWASADGLVWEPLLTFDWEVNREDVVWIHDLVVRADQLVILTSHPWAEIPSYSIWVSESGAEWSERSLELSLLDPGNASAWYPVRLTATGSRFVLLGHVETVDPVAGRIAVWVSEDLAAWTYVDTGEVMASTRLWHLSPVEWSGGLLVWGVECNDDGSCWEPQIHFVSPDGLSWTRVAPDPEVFTVPDEAFIHAGGAGLVAISPPAIWQSEEGITWSPVGGAGDELGARGSAMTFTGEQVVLLGLTDNDRWTSWIWTQD